MIPKNDIKSLSMEYNRQFVSWLKGSLLHPVGQRAQTCLRIEICLPFCAVGRPARRQKLKKQTNKKNKRKIGQKMGF